MKTRSIGENEVFVGWLHNEIYSQDEVTPINGFGVVFRDGWPIGYGQYHNGKLHGLGRKG